MIKTKRITTSVSPDWRITEYPTCSPFSAQNKWLLLQHSGGAFGLYAGDGVFKRMTTIRHNDEPRWDRTDPDVLYYIHWNMLMSLNVATEEETLIRIFSEYAEFTPDGRNGITGGGESDISPDGKHLVLANGDKTEVFVFSVDNTKGPVFHVEPFDGLKLSQSNKIVLSRTGDGIYVSDSTGWRKLVPYDAHAVVTVDIDGSEVIVWAESGDFNRITKTRLADGHSTVLLDLGWAADPTHSMAANISACDWPEVLVSLYGNDATVKYANQILRLPLIAGSDPGVLCDTNSKVLSNAYYNAMPHAALSRDGSRFVFSSNSGKTDNPDYADVFLGIIDEVPKPDTSIIIPVNTTETFVDYRSFAGNAEFAIIPQLACPTCGSTVRGIIERKLK